MRAWLRRLRGVAGLATVWAVAGGLVGIALGSVAALLGVLSSGSQVIIAGEALGLVGALAGAGFGVLLASIDGRRTLEQLSPVRAAAWGAAAGVLVPLLFLLGEGVVPLAELGDYVLASGLFGVLGAGLGAGTLRLAKGQHERLGSGEADLLDGGSD